MQAMQNQDTEPLARDTVSSGAGHCRSRGGIVASGFIGREQDVSGLGAIEGVLGADAALLEHQCTTIPAASLQLPGPDFIDRCYAPSDRPTRVLTSLHALFGAGRLADTGYLSLLPVDQGIEHSAGASFAPNPDYFDPANIVKLAIEGCFDQW